jgi:ethanolamine utilization protein EutP (predicted NTPase)
VKVDPAGRIDGRTERRTMLRRQVGVKGEQVLAANLDQVALVVAPGPLLREGFLARSICGVIAENLHPLIVFQKVDLDEDHAMAARAGLYAALGFDVVGTSAKSEEGVEELKRRFAGKTTAMLGQSGVGKSSLVNVMYGLDLTIGEVDAWGRGRLHDPRARDPGRRGRAADRPAGRARVRPRAARAGGARQGVPGDRGGGAQVPHSGLSAPRRRGLRGGDGGREGPARPRALRGLPRHCRVVHQWSRGRRPRLIEASVAHVRQSATASLR